MATLPSLQFKTIGEALWNSYATFVGKAPEATLFHTPAWKEVLETMQVGEAHYFALTIDQTLRAVLPAFVRTDPALGSVLNALPFFQSTGAILLAQESTSEQRREIQDRLLRDVLTWSKDEGVDSVVIVGNGFLDGEEPDIRPEPDFVWRRSFWALDLRSSKDLPSFVRRMLSKAEREHLTFRRAGSVEDVAKMYDLHQVQMTAVGARSHPKELYTQLFQRNAQQPVAHFAMVEKGGRLLSSLVTLLHSDRVDYYSPGTSEEGRQCQAHSWLCRQEMVKARTEGIFRWNWMPSPNEGVDTFKSRWGGDKRTYAIRGWHVSDRFRSPNNAKRFVEAHPAYFVSPF